MVLATIAVGAFVSVLDQTGVTLALPPLATHFDATLPVVQWVALGYSLTTGALLLPMGRLSDMVGRKVVYMIGFVIFILGALLAGSSPSLLTVIIFRTIQGSGSAMIQANSMAILTSMFPASQRGRVIGMYMTMVGMGAIAGPVIGGTVVELLGWRAVFYMGVPLGVVSLAAAALVLERDRPAGVEGGISRVRFDWAGAVLSTTALVVFLLSMTNAYRIGWTSPLVFSAFAAAFALLISFIVWERRTAEPLLALELFRRKLFSMGSSASFLIFLAGTSVFYMMPFYLQGVLDLSPGRAGMVIAPTALCFALTGPIAGRLSDRYGFKRFEITGLLMLSASMLLLSRLTEDTRIHYIIPVLVMQGIAMGMFNSPNASSILSTVEPARYGVATAFINMIRTTANVTGIGLAITIVTAQMAAQGFEPSLDAVSSGGAGVEGAFTEGLRITFLLMAGFVACSLTVTILKPLPRTAGPTAAQQADVGSTAQTAE
ncbi:MAG: DHA2 family efflux MFS transporter permease subunit [SAR202 cluster bacterium]|nr:DHA2 family efflux MFS transporter permease subunit [SAR202 cluster bacterium]